MISEITLFGRLKSFSPKGKLLLETSDEMLPQDLRRKVADALQLPLEEFTSSAVANHDRVLSEKEKLGEGTEFSLLPPVCGG